MALDHQHYGPDHGATEEANLLLASSVRCSGEETILRWWYHHFELVWKPFIQRLSRQKKVTLREFERAASQVTGLTPIEKAIAVLAFREQHE
jgi:hypothetical protein